MSAQPANSTIGVYRNVRAYRNQRRHETVEALTKKQRALLVAVPGEEHLLTVVAARDTTKKDFSPYGRDGQPVVVGRGVDTTPEQVVEGITGADFPIRIGNDVFITQTAGNLTRDLHQDVRDVV